MKAVTIFAITVFWASITGVVVAFLDGWHAQLALGVCAWAWALMVFMVVVSRASVRRGGEASLYGAGSLPDDFPGKSEQARRGSGHNVRVKAGSPVSSAHDFRPDFDNPFSVVNLPPLPVVPRETCQRCEGHGHVLMDGCGPFSEDCPDCEGRGTMPMDIPSIEEELEQQDTCQACSGDGETNTGKICPACHGTGERDPQPFAIPCTECGEPNNNGCQLCDECSKNYNVEEYDFAADDRNYDASKGA